jgi:hypothetical protein
VNLLANLDKKDAELFQVVARYVWTSGISLLLIFDVDAAIYQKLGLTFHKLRHLESLGLIHYENSGFQTVRLKRPVRFTYHKTSVVCSPLNAGDVLQLGGALLTETGNELLRLCDDQPLEGFFDYLVQEWEGADITVTSPSEADSEATTLTAEEIEGMPPLR